jgi:hypothetical protein
MAVAAMKILDLWKLPYTENDIGGPRPAAVCPKKQRRLIMRIRLWLSVVLIAAMLPLRAAEKTGRTTLKIKLPRPMFTGTPRNIRTANLEPPRKEQKRAPFPVPAGTVLLSGDKEVSGSDEEPVIGDLEQLTDGDKEGVEGSYVELGPGKQYVQIDLEQEAKLYAIVIWHYHSQARVYHDVVVQTAADPDFVLNVKTVFNNDHDNSSGLGVGKDYEYIETYEGRLIPVQGVKARYVRLYSNGNTSDDMNHYTEVEVYGVPLK